MASSIPRTRRKEYTDAVAAMTLKAALFTAISGYDPLTATTYAALLSGGATEVASGNGYTTGGATMTGLASANLATNGAIVTATATAWTSASFTARYVCIYNTSTGKIQALVDLGADYTVLTGTLTITWDATNGVINVA